MPQLGKAYIEVRADLSKFPAELKKELKKALAEGVAGVSFDGLADKAEEAAGTAAHRAGDKFEREGKRTFKSAAEGIGRETSRGFLGSIRAIFSRRGGSGGGGLFGGVIKNLFSGAQDAIKTGVQGLSDVGGKIGGVLGAIGGGGGDIASLIKVAAILAAIPAVFGLVGALVHLSGALLALPAAAGVAAAGISVLVVAFQGFGEALSAGFSGDTEKFKQALKGLAEPAQTVVKEIVGLKSIFKSIKSDVQTAFFAPMIGIFKLLGKTLLPEIRFGMQDVADALGNLFAKILTLGTENDIFKDVGKIFDSTGRIIRDLTGPITELFAVMFGVVKHGLPFVERFFHFVGEGLTRLTGFLSGSLKSGSFERFLENAAKIGRELFGILGEVGHLIGAIFGGQDVAEGSTQFLSDIKKAIKALADFFDSEQGKQVIQGWLVVLKGLGIALIGVAIFLGKAFYWTDQFVRGVQAAVVWVLKFLQAIGGGFVSGLQAVGSFFESIGSAIADFFTETIPNAFNAVVEFIQSLPTRIRDGLIALFGFIVSFIAEQIGRLIGIILALPYLISTLPERVSAIFDTVMGFISGLGQRALDSLVSFGGSVLTFFSNLWENIKTLVGVGIDAVVNFFGSLPGRILALGPALLNAAKSLGRKIGEGFSEIGNFASDIGKKIVSAIKSGINFIIDGINRGIADIDDKIPIGLPRLPHFERGGIVSSPTVALLGEKNKREVVLPLSDPARAQQLAEQSGLAKILSRGAAAPSINLTAVLDGFGFIKVIRMVAGDMLDEQGAELSYGART
jgi:phage-related protein